MLPFTLETYFATLAQFGRSVWPAPIAGYVLGLAALWIARGGGPGRSRGVVAILAFGWAGAGVGFHLLHFAAINFAAPVYAILFVVQALLLAWFGIVRDRVRFRMPRGFRGAAALILAVIVFVAWPLTGYAVGGGVAAVTVPGLDPTATALLTLTLLLCAQGPAARWLLPIPAIWTFVDGATLLALGAPAGLVFPAAALVVIALLVLKRGERMNVEGEPGIGRQ